jgi:hypothetical protein
MQSVLLRVAATKPAKIRTRPPRRGSIDHLLAKANLAPAGVPIAAERKQAESGAREAAAHELERKSQQLIRPFAGAGAKKK